MRYRCRRPEEPKLRQRLRELAAKRRRFGYRRLGVLLRREAFASTTSACTGFTAKKGYAVRRRARRASVPLKSRAARARDCAESAVGHGLS